MLNIPYNSVPQFILITFIRIVSSLCNIFFFSVQNSDSNNDASNIHAILFFSLVSSCPFSGALMYYQIKNFKN